MNSLVYLEVSPPNTIIGGTSPRRDAIGGSCWGGLSLHYIANFKKFLKKFWELLYTLQCYICMISFDEFLEDYKKRHSLSSGETIYTEKALKEIVAEYLEQCQFLN